MQNQKLTTVNETETKKRKRQKKLKEILKKKTPKGTWKHVHSCMGQHVRSERMLNEFLINQREPETETEIRNQRKTKKRNERRRWWRQFAVWEKVYICSINVYDIYNSQSGNLIILQVCKLAESCKRKKFCCFFFLVGYSITICFSHTKSYHNDIESSLK